MNSVTSPISSLSTEQPPLGLTGLAGSLCVLAILSVLFLTSVLGTPLIVVIIAIFLPVVLLCALYPIHAICALFTLLPFDFFLSSYSDAQGSLVEYVEAAVVGGALISLAVRRKLIRPCRHGWLVVAVGATTIISYFISLKTHEIQVKTAENIVHCLLFFSLVALMRSEQDRETLLSSLRVPFGIIIIASLYQIVIWNYGFLFRLLYPQSFLFDYPFERVSGPFEHPNTNAGFVVGLFCLIGIPYAVRGRTKGRVVFWVLLAVTAAVVGASGSNGAAAGLAAALLVYVCFFSERRFRNLTWLLLACTIGGLALLAHGGSRIETSSEGRMLMWLASGQMFLSSPWIGRGVGSFSEWYGDYLPPQVFANHIAASAHSIYVNTLAETGLIGLGLLLVLLYKVWQDALSYARSPRIEYRYFSASILCFIAYFSVHGLVDQLTYHGNYSVFFWALIALSSAFWERSVTSTSN